MALFLSHEIKPTKRKRVVLTLAQKIDICKRLEEGVKKSVLIKEYNVGSSTIYDISSRKEQFLNFFQNAETTNSVQHRRTLRKPRLEQLDAVLYEWYSIKRSEGVIISGQMLVDAAKDFYKQLELTEPCAFSEGWLSRFKLRHGISYVNSEYKPVDPEATQKYCDSFMKLVTEHGVAPEQIYNVEETRLYWQNLPNFNILTACEGNATSKQNNDRINVLACTNATGTHKIKLLVIGKRKYSRVFDEIQDAPVVYKTQINLRMEKYFINEWFQDTFVPAVKKHLEVTNQPENTKVILLIKNSQFYPSEEELMNENIFAIFLPRNVSSSILPMNQGIIQNLKFCYRKELLRKFILHECNIQNFQSFYCLKDAIYSLAEAWESIECEILKEAWRQLLIKSDAHSEEDFNSMFKKKSAQQIVELFENATYTNLIKNLKVSELVKWTEGSEDIEIATLLKDSKPDINLNSSNKKINDIKLEQNDSLNHSTMHQCNVTNDDVSFETDDNAPIESIENSEIDIFHEPIKLDKDNDDEEYNKSLWGNTAAAFDTVMNFVKTQNCFNEEETEQLCVLYSKFNEKCNDLR